MFKNLLKFLEIFKTLDIRALLIKEDNEWICLFCIIQPSIYKEDVILDIQNRKRTNLDFSEPNGIKIVFESKIMTIYL
jgi:hypothetical protein